MPLVAWLWVPWVPPSLPRPYVCSRLYQPLFLVLTHDPDDSDDEHHDHPPAPPAEHYGEPAPSGPVNAYGQPIDQSDRESVASAREEYREALEDSSASSSDVEEAREEYIEELEEAYYDE